MWGGSILAPLLVPQTFFVPSDNGTGRGTVSWEGKPIPRINYHSHIGRIAALSRMEGFDVINLLPCGLLVFFMGVPCQFLLLTGGTSVLVRGGLCGWSYTLATISATRATLFMDPFILQALGRPMKKLADTHCVSHLSNRLFFTSSEADGHLVDTDMKKKREICTLYDCC